MDLANGLKAFYSMDSGWLDSSGNNYNFPTSTATISNTLQHIGTGCGDFSGSAQYARQDLPAGIKTTTAAYAAWVKLDVNNVQQRVIAAEPKGASILGAGAGIVITSAGKPVWYTGTGAVSWYSCEGTTVLDTSGYHFLVGMHDGDNCHLFVDNVYECVTPSPLPINWSDNESGEGPLPASLFLGGYNNNTAQDDPDIEFLNGNLDSTGIWGRGLTWGDVQIGEQALGEVARLWNNGKGQPSIPIPMTLQNNADYLMMRGGRR